MNHSSHPNALSVAKYVARGTNSLPLESHFLECEECFFVLSIILRVLVYKPTEEEKKILAILTFEKLRAFRA